MKNKYSFEFAINLFLLLFSVLFFKDNLCAQNLKKTSAPLKILSYNVLDGFQRDEAVIATFMNWVDSVKPEIVALQEMNFFDQKSLELLANKMKFPYAVLLKETGYPVALLSKFPIVEVKKVTDNMSHGFIRARILDYNIVVLHLTPWITEKKIDEITTVLAEIDNIPPDEKIMVMGDFNSLSFNDRIMHGQKLIDAEIILEKRMQKAILVNGKIDYTVCNKMEENGFVDSWTLFNKTPESSCPTLKYSPLDPPRSYRVDYIWVNKTLQKDCTNAYIVKDSTTDWLSDHYPVILELK